MKLVKPNWYGLDHSAVTNKFEGSPTFCNDFCVNGEYNPSAVYFCAKPNKRKGHKTFVLLTRSGQDVFIRGMSPRDMEKYRYQDALHCLSCDDVIYSINRHDMRGCSCGNVAIDGGKDYTKVSFKSDAKYKHVVVDLITDLISDPK